MKPPSFDYFAPRSLDEALALLSEFGGDGKVLAGGQSLMPMLNFRLLAPACLVDINKIETLDAISHTDGEFIIGALTRIRSLEKSNNVTRAYPLIREVVPHIAHFQIRNRGTLGGSLAHADPAAELPAAIVALEGSLVLTSKRGERIVPADGFFTGYMATCLEPDELLTQIRLPRHSPSAGFGFMEVARRHGDFALVGVAAILSLDEDEICKSVVIVLTGVHETPVRSTAAMDALTGSVLNERSITEAARIAADQLTPQSDIHASSEYRVRAARVLTARVLAKAAERARAIRHNTSGSAM